MASRATAWAAGLSEMRATEGEREGSNGSLIILVSQITKKVQGIGEMRKGKFCFQTILSGGLKEREQREKERERRGGEEK